MGKSKHLNPVDRARKEDRKKELKKNKKQRQQVRTSVIEEKDPEHIICELEKLDKIELNADSNSTQVNENLIKSKRKRLLDIWERIIIHYSKEDTSKHESLKKMFANYDANRLRLTNELNAIKAAQEINLDQILLPDDNTSDDVSNLVPQPPAPKQSKNLSRSAGIIQPSIQPSQSSHQHQHQRPLPPTIPSTNQISSQINQEPKSTISKPAGPVIESKPVIFRPKVTKFIPVSVQRKKMANK